MRKYLHLILPFFLCFFPLLLAAQDSYQWKSTIHDPIFYQPHGIAIDEQDNLYITELDESSNCIKKYTNEGELVFKIGGFYNGQDTEQFNGPRGLVLDKDGNIYIAESKNNRIHKVSSEGVSLLKFGSKGLGDGQFDSPRGVALDKDGNIYVVDTYNSRVQKFSKEGAFLLKFGSKGKGNGQFDLPVGIAIDIDGNVYIADGLNHRIQKFTSEGVFLSTFGSGGVNVGQLNLPGWLAIDKDRNIYVVENASHRIQKFSAEGISMSTFGTRGTGEGQFEVPNGIAIDKNNNIYIADLGNNRIQKFSAEGVFIKKYGGPIEGPLHRPICIDISKDGSIYVGGSSSYFTQYSENGLLIKKIGQGQTGTNDGQFYMISDLEVDQQENIYIVDVANHRIQKFSKEGVFLAKFGVLGLNDGQLKGPEGIAIDKEGNLYICDRSNNRIQKFSGDGIFLMKFGTAGNSDGQFNSPNDIVIDKDGNIYVSDTNNNRIQKFSRKGEFLLKFGSFGSGAGQFNSPAGMAIDSIGNLYVADQFNNRIQKFSGDGNFLLEFGSLGSRQGQFDAPGAVDIDKQGNVYVTEFYNSRVQVFSPVVKLSQTITFDSIPDKIANDPPFALSAKTSSGLPISFSIVSGPATISDSIITLTGVGEVTVRASQLGNEQYNPALAVDHSFEVKTVLGIEKNESGIIKIFPNPSSSVLKLELPIFREGFVGILDSKGILIEKITLKREQVIDIPVQHFVKGIYLLRIELDNVNFVKRIVIQ